MKLSASLAIINLLSSQNLIEAVGRHNSVEDGVSNVNFATPAAGPFYAGGVCRGNIGQTFEQSMANYGRNSETNQQERDPLERSRQRWSHLPLRRHRHSDLQHPRGQD